MRVMVLIKANNDTVAASAVSDISWSTRSRPAAGPKAIATATAWRAIDSPMRIAACITFFSIPGGSLPVSGGSGLSPKRISISTFAPRTRR